MHHPLTLFDNELIFSGNFDSGNLEKAERSYNIIEYIGQNSDKVEENGVSVIPIIGIERRPLLRCKPDYYYKVWTSLDACGTPFQNGNRSWFHFYIQKYVPGSTIRISIMNLNRQSKLFSQGYTPVFKVVGPDVKELVWTRLPEEPIFESQAGQFTITFAHKFSSIPDTTTYFAFCLPWSYEELQSQLSRIEKHIDRTTIYNQSHRYGTHSTRKTTQEKLPEIYFHRELLCFTLGGRRLDLLTISDHANQLQEPEERFDPLLFPDLDHPRPLKFINKKVFIITARVHPGETPGSYMFNGILEFLLRENDRRAIELRRMYVFKLIPMLNPDGVALGHYRTDTRGVNLNRVYLNPNFLLYPTVYAAKAVAVYYHLHYGTSIRYPGYLPMITFELFFRLVCEIRRILDHPDLSQHTGSFRQTNESGRAPGDKDSEPKSPLQRQKKRIASSAIVASKQACRRSLMSEKVFCVSQTTLDIATQEIGELSSRPLLHEQWEIRSDELLTKQQNHPFRRSFRPTSAFSVLNMQRQHNRRNNIISPPIQRSLPFAPKSSISPLSLHAFRSLTSSQSKIKCHDPCPLQICKTSTGTLGNVNNKDWQNEQKNCVFLNSDAYQKFTSNQSNPESMLNKKIESAIVKNMAKLEADTTKNVYNDEENESENDASKDANQKEFFNKDEELLKLISDRLICEESMKQQFFHFCQGDHLTDPQLLDIPPQNSNVQCYIDLHGHCTKRGCFCYGNCIKEEKQMIENVLFPRLVAANSAFFDFASCNFTSKNMYSKDRSSELSKEGSGRVGIFKSTGITHCYTVEANYNSGCQINILTEAAGDNRCVTPPGSLWGPLRKDRFASNSLNATNNYVNFAIVMRPVTLTDYGGYTLNFNHLFVAPSFEEMGRGLLIAALDMWGVNPWSRLSTNLYSEMLRFKPGMHRNIRSLIIYSNNGGSHLNKLTNTQSRVRSEEECNLKIIRNFVKKFVLNYAIRERFTLIKNQVQENDACKTARSISGSKGVKLLPQQDQSLSVDANAKPMTSDSCTLKADSEGSMHEAELEILDRLNHKVDSPQHSSIENKAAENASCSIANLTTETRDPLSELIHVRPAISERVPSRPLSFQFLPTAEHCWSEQSIGKQTSPLCKCPSKRNSNQYDSVKSVLPSHCHEINLQRTKDGSGTIPSRARQIKTPKINSVPDTTVAALPRRFLGLDAKPASLTITIFNNKTINKKQKRPISMTPVAVQAKLKALRVSKAVPQRAESMRPMRSSSCDQGSLHFQKQYSEHDTSQVKQEKRIEHARQMRKTTSLSSSTNFHRNFFRQNTPQKRQEHRTHALKTIKAIPKRYASRSPLSKSKRSSTMQMFSQNIETTDLGQRKPIKIAAITSITASMARGKRLPKKQITATPEIGDQVSGSSAVRASLIKQPPTLSSKCCTSTQHRKSGVSFSSTMKQMITHLPSLKPIIKEGKLTKLNSIWNDIQ